MICTVCEGGGQVTDDEFRQTMPTLQAEIDRDEKDGGRSSRTRLAIESGILKFVGCVACNGQGVIEV